MSEHVVPGPKSRNRPFRPQATTVAVLIVGLFVTGVLSWLSLAANVRNNQRLLNLQTREAGSVLNSALPTIETPLASSAALATATGGSAEQFAHFMSAYVGKHGPFVDASLWQVHGASVARVARVGATPGLSTTRARSTLSHLKPSSVLSVIGVLGGGAPRLSYVVVSGNSARMFAVLAESLLPPKKVAPINRSSAFSDLNYALYLGRSARSDKLVEASTARLPLAGPTASTTVPFGSSAFTFVAAPTSELGGQLSEDLWWLIALVGTAMALLAAVSTDRIARGRRAAELLAGENARLLAQQRGVAETLQRALLPDALPRLGGIEVAARYVPGVAGLEIGGDWYDLLQLDQHRLLFVVGDVSGRGLRAAAIMASVRFAIRAYALEGDRPDAILAKLAEVVNIGRDGHFVTVLCALVDDQARTATFANAGHPLAIMSNDTSTEFVSTPIGPPIGVPNARGYTSSSVAFGPGDTLIGFTDGLFERRKEHLDLSLARLLDAVAADRSNGSLENLLSALVAELVPGGPSDDVALLGMRWQG